MRKSLAQKSDVKPKRIFAAMLAFAQLLLLLPTSLPVNVMAAGSVEYKRINPEVSIYNAQTGIDEKLYEREINASSKFNAATKSSLFNLPFEDNLVGRSASFNLDDKDIGKIRRKDNNLQTSASASFHNYKHQHTWRSGLFGINKNTANVTTAGMMSYKYRISGYNYSPNLFINSRDMAKDYERLSTGYSSVFSYESTLKSCNAYFAASLQGTMYDGGNKSCVCPGDASINKPAITYMDPSSPSIVSVTGIDNKILKAGDTVDLEVKFDEPIRFADDSNAHDDLYVNLAISGISSDRYPKAMLEKLDTDTLYFSYTLPSDATNLEQTITGVDFSPLMKECDLSVVFEDESFTLSTSELSNTSNIGYTRATSYITDIAGNGMRESDRLYNVTEAYIDTKAPVFTKINTAVNANNSSVKEMTGSSDTDNSDIYLGIGDSIEYGLTVSEVLDIEEGEYTNLTAETNIIKDGMPVKLTSKTISKIPTDDNAYGLGPSKGNVTYIALDTLTIEESMECTDADGIIRIKSISLSNAVSDLAANKLTVSDEDISALNNVTLYLDIERPQITTTLNQIEDVYSVVPYEDGSGFYFPFEIKDDTSGTNGLQGSFKWNKGDSSVYGSRYYYAVTSSADIPDEWETGTMNLSHKFKQVEGTQYLHIKKYGGDTYEMLGTTLSFTGMDYAGNTYTSSNPVSFKINTVWDNTYPVAALGEVTKQLTDTGGTMTVSVNLTESSALKDAYYLWTDTEDEPAPGDISLVPAGDVSDLTQATVTITENISEGTDFNKYLWFKVSDKNGNEMVYNLGRHRYNLGTIDYSVSTSDDYSYNLYIFYATNDPDGFLLGLHPVPETDNEYYACVNGSQTYELSNWYKVRSDDRRTFEVLEKTDIDNEYLADYLFNNSSSGTYSETFGYRTGDCVFYIISGAKGAYTFDDSGYVLSAGNSSYNVSEESYNIRVLSPFDEGQDFYEGRSLTSQSEIPEMPSYYYYYNRDEMLSTLAGLTFDIDLGVDLMGWNYDGIDFCWG